MQVMERNRELSSRKADTYILGDCRQTYPIVPSDKQLAKTSKILRALEGDMKLEFTLTIVKSLACVFILEEHQDVETASITMGRRRSSLGGTKRPHQPRWGKHSYPLTRSSAVKGRGCAKGQLVALTNRRQELFPLCLETITPTESVGQYWIGGSNPSCGQLIEAVTILTTRH